MTLSLEEATAALTAPGQPFEMEEREIRGQRLRVWKHAPPTLRHVLEASRAHGDAVFLVYEDERTTFERHFARVAALANALVERYGIAKGDRVAIAMRNFPEWSLAFWAAAGVGAVVVPLNAWWSGDELEYGLADSGSVLLFADRQRAERLVDHLGPLDLRGVVVARPADGLPAGHERFEDVLGDVPSDPHLPPVDLDPEDDATIFYTSGTTGRPKGAVGTHRNICTNLLSLGFTTALGALRFADDRSGDGRQRRPAYLLSVPFFHATGCHSVLVSNLFAGNKLVIMHRWDPERALELIEREEITAFGGVPAMAMQVLESPSFATRDTSSVATVSYGGAPAPPELVRRIKELFPWVTPRNGYGLTETSSVTTMNRGPDYERKPDSVGRPVPVCDLKVVGPDGEELPRGSVGELWIRGPNVVKGYWRNPEATAEAITDGWLHTGDVARIDEEGFVYIVDRAKDMIIRGGENVYCVEVESVLHEHPAVMEAAVIGLPHRVLGEEVGAVVQLKPGATATEDELRSFVAERLAAFKVPVRIDVRADPLPRSPQGKILKRELRAQVVGG